MKTPKCNFLVLVEYVQNPINDQKTLQMLITYPIIYCKWENPRKTIKHPIWYKERKEKHWLQEQENLKTFISKKSLKEEQGLRD